MAQAISRMLEQLTSVIRPANHIARANRTNPNRLFSDKRLRIISWAALIGLIAGVIEMGLPAEDTFRALRNSVRSQAADPKIIVVAVDDASLNELAVKEPDRKDDARLLDVLFAAGADRVFFDRAYADPTNEQSDKAFAEALERHANVYLGAAPEVDLGAQRHAELTPARMFRDKAGMASMLADVAPFGLGWRLPTRTQIAGASRPSISAGLADYDGTPIDYRIDFAHDVATIPSLSYGDVLNKRFDGNTFDGAAIVIGKTSYNNTDKHYLPLGQKVPGVYFHALGANTLVDQVPRDLGWVPPLMATFMFMGWQARRRRPSKLGTVAFAGSLITVPFILDYMAIGIDVFPSALCLSIAAMRLGRLSKSMFAQSTGFLRVEALEARRIDRGHIVIALKMRDFALMTTSYEDSMISELLDAAVNRLSTTEDAEFAFHKDTLVWIRPAIAQDQIEAHVHGLQAMFGKGMLLTTTTVNLAASLGVDTNYELPVRARIATAVQAAEDAMQVHAPYVIANTEHMLRRRQRIGLLTDLELDMQKGLVEVAYQPKVSLPTGRIVGAEALVRWTHSERGFVDPSDLIEIVEAHNRTNEFTDYVLDAAFKAAGQAIELDLGFKIAVNISPLSLRNEDTVYRIGQVAKRHGISPRSIILEVTESCPIDDYRIAGVLAALQKTGFTISIDDFGTGHSTFDSIRHIQGSEVKIDRSFVSDMLETRGSMAVVEATIAMAHRLDMSVVAEGVENQAIVDTLIAMGCDQAQGFYYSRAISIEDMLAKLTIGRIAA